MTWPKIYLAGSARQAAVRLGNREEAGFPSAEVQMGETETHRGSLLVYYREFWTYSKVRKTTLTLRSLPHRERKGKLVEEDLCSHL